MIETVMTREQWELVYEREYRAKRKARIEALLNAIFQRVIGIVIILLGFVFVNVFAGEDQGGALLLWAVGALLLLCPKTIIGK